MKFFCYYERCGRAFQKEQDLKTHMSRRHVKAKTLLEDQKAKDKLEGKIEIKKPQKKVSNETGDMQKPTVELILESSGQDALEDVTELILKEKGLKEFISNDDVDLEDLSELEYLSLSHNVLTKIDGVSDLLRLKELNLNNNLISDISALENLAQLARLFLANNQVKVILSLKPLKQLSELSVYNNKLYDLDSSLKVLAELPKLKSLEIERNPCTLQTKNSRYKILHKLRLDSLEGEPITDVDMQICVKMFGERQVYVPKNVVGRLRANAEIQGNAERELLVHEIEELKEVLTEITEERDRLKEEKEKVSQESAEYLKDENSRLRKEVTGMFVLLDEVNDLRGRLREGVGAYASEIYEENQRLRVRLSELEKTQEESKAFRRPHTSAGVRPVTASVQEAGTDEIYEYVERKNRMLINLDSKVQNFKQDVKKSAR